MKNFLVVLILFAVFSSCNTEKDGIPSAVKAKFEKEYPDVVPKWEQEGEYFEAEFKTDGAENSVLFDAEGNIVLKEMEIIMEALPEDAMIYLQENFAGEKIREVEKGESSEDGVFFKVEIKKDGKEMDILFNEKGGFIKTEAEDEGEDTEMEEGENEDNEGIEIPMPEKVNMNDIEEIPGAIKTFIAENYPEHTINEAEIEATYYGDVYEIELLNADGEEMDLIFDVDGKFIGQEDEETEDMDNDGDQDDDSDDDIED
jgi:uncharacterized protein YxeA